MPSKYSLAAADLESRFSAELLRQLTDGTSSYVGAKIDAQITAEESDFEGFAGRYYALPVRTASSAVPGVVRERLLDGIALRLLAMKPQYLMEGGEWFLWYRDTRKALEQWKRDLASPKREVTLPDGVERSAVVADISATPLVTSDASVYTTGYLIGSSSEDDD